MTSWWCDLGIEQTNWTFPLSFKLNGYVSFSYVSDNDIVLNFVSVSSTRLVRAGAVHAF